MTTSVMRDYDHLCGKDAKFFEVTNPVCDGHDWGIPWAFIALGLLIWALIVFI